MQPAITHRTTLGLSDAHIDASKQRQHIKPRKRRTYAHRFPHRFDRIHDECAVNHAPSLFRRAMKRACRQIHGYTTVTSRPNEDHISRKRRFTMSKALRCMLKVSNRCVFDQRAGRWFRYPRMIFGHSITNETLLES